MAAKATKKTTPLISACEEYVVEQLKEAQKTIAELTLKLSQNDFTIDQLEKKQAVMFGYLLLAFSKSAGSRVEISDNLVSVYVLDRYLGLFDKENVKDEKDTRLYAIWKIIEKVNATPVREK